jgi:peptidoglycan/LPS O-acetylase OafA/YrhL
MTSDNSSGKNYYPGLTSLRAIAAFMVYLHHFNPLPPSLSLFGFSLWGIVQEFHVGVTIFFVLSGFLITDRYLDAQIDFKTYFWFRFCRIYPVYFIISVLTLIMSLASYGLASFNFKELFLNITLTKGFFDQYKFSMVGQGWSLTVEETFYLLAPLILFLIRKKSSLILIPLTLLFLSIGLLISLLCSGSHLWGDFGFTLRYTFFGRSSEFLIGMFVAILIKSKTPIKYNFFFHPVFGFLSLCIFTFLLHILALQNNTKFGIFTYKGIIINSFFVPVFVMIPILIGFSKFKNKHKFLDAKTFQILGKASYIFYLIHMGVIRTLLSSMGIKNESVLLVLLLILSYLLWRYIEEPLNRFLRKKYYEIGLSRL